MSATLSVAGGGRARLVELAGDRVVLVCETSTPPGSTISLVMAPEPKQYALKVIGCRRGDDGYRIEARLVNVSREQRMWLERLIAP